MQVISELGEVRGTLPKICFRKEQLFFFLRSVKITGRCPSIIVSVKGDREDVSEQSHLIHTQESVGRHERNTGKSTGEVAQPAAAPHKSHHV